MGLWQAVALCPCRGKPDLHEGAVKEGPLGDDQIGAEAAGDSLLGGL